MGKRCLEVLCTIVLIGACGPAEDDEDPREEASEGDAPERFPCGDGGTCLVATEMCLEEPNCALCAPLPAACDPDLSCGCLPPANDPAFGPSGCTDVGSCEQVDGGLVITCAEAANWGCG